MGWKRATAKSLTWRVTGTLVTFAISLLFTGRVEISGAIAIAEAAAKVAAYVLHEKVWEVVCCGKGRGEAGGCGDA